MKYVNECKCESIREIREREHTGAWKVRENYTRELSLNDYLQTERDGRSVRTQGYGKMEKCEEECSKQVSVSQETAELSLEMKYVGEEMKEVGKIRGKSLISAVPHGMEEAHMLNM